MIRTTPNQSPPSSLPLRDHTLGEPDGHLIKVNLPSLPGSMTYNIPADITADHTLPISYQPHPTCLKIWYFMGSSTFAVVDDYFNITTTTQSSAQTRTVDRVTDSTLFYFNLTNQWVYRRVNFNLAISDLITINA